MSWNCMPGASSNHHTKIPLVAPWNSGRALTAVKSFRQSMRKLSVSQLRRCFSAGMQGSPDEFAHVCWPMWPLQMVLPKSCLFYSLLSNYMQGLQELKDVWGVMGQRDGFETDWLWRVQRPFWDWLIPLTVLQWEDASWDMVKHKLISGDGDEICSH